MKTGTNNPQPPHNLNHLGLAVALAVFMILMAQVHYDRHYNRCFADSERMYRVEENTDNQGYSHWMVGSYKAKYLDSLDEVESVYQFDLTQQADISYCNPVLANSVEDVGGLSFGTIYSTQFFDFFGYKCVDGSFSDFDRDDEIVIPESLAKKVFPKESAVGKTLLLNDNYFGEDTILKQKIVAVYKDMPQNNSFGNPLFFIETPQLAYNVVEINQDSIRALWDGDSDFETEVWGVGQNCTPDSLFVEVFLYSKEKDDTTKVYKEKYVKVRATCDPNDPAPALVKDTMKMPNPWGSLYCKLKSGADPNAIAAKLKERFYSSEDPDDEPCEVRLMAVNDIHFEDDAIRYNKQDSVSRFVVNCLAGIAWVVLIIAFLNFANFAIAEAPLRMRRVNTRKVLGESDGGIWWSMAKGYITLSLLAFLIAFVIFLICTRLPEIPMLSNSVTLSSNVSIILMTLLLSIVAGVIVSIYPTRMVTVVSPDVALKGSYGFSKTGRRLRTLFIGLQFFLASVILTCTLYVAVQNRYLKTYDMGYQTHNILNFDADFRKLDSIEPYIHALEQLSGVEDVTASSWPIVRNSGYVLYGRKLVSPDSAKTQVVEFHAMHVYPNFMEFFGIRMSDGRTFIDCDTSGNRRYVVFNKKAQDQYHLALDWHYDSQYCLGRTTLIGIAEDFHFRPLFDTIQPLGIEVGNYGQVLRQFFIKYEENADTAALIREIHSLTPKFTKYDGKEAKLNISTLDDDIVGFYEKEAGLSKGLFILCGIAVLLALMGVAGMLLLEMTYRRPELGIRQIFGSSTGQLLARANGKYALLCTVAFALSVPVSLLLLHKWLQMFVCHAPITVWIFLLAYLILLVLTVLVVTVQTALSLRFEPVEVIHGE